ncbi:MAG: AAA family ATPase [Deltaproteobacteria bacterium]|nr:AAA family ATPase [Deltaproteobacteria bacterium]
MALPPLIQTLLKPSAYPDLPEAIEFKQTHISYLFFTPAHVYKIKKPVNFGFLDFTTLEKRRFFCHQEITLNKRLSPGIYIDVVEVNKKNSKFVFEGKGETVEYAVKMKRLPSDKMMDNLLKKDNVTDSMIKRIANVIAGFHKRTATNLYTSKFGHPSVIEKNIEENFAQTKNFAGRTITKMQFDAIKTYVQNFLKAKHGLFTKRMEQGFIKDCHGDIHSEHICITNGIYIFDCIEFNEMFRYSDTVADIAFLAMDLDFYNHNDLSETFCEEYIKASKDTAVYELLDFYKCYRAYVRGKVESFKIDQNEIPKKEKDASELRAKKYFHLAKLYATGGFKPALILLCGFTGTGKTTVANSIAEEVGTKIISSDIVRKELANIKTTEHRFEKFGKGIYTDAFTEKTYEEIIKRAESFLKNGCSVILDATFQKPKYRQSAAELAKRLGAEFHIIECTTAEDVIKQRLDRRANEEGVASDGRWEIYIRQKKQYEAFSRIKRSYDQPSAFSVDTSLDIDKTKNIVLEKIFGS